MIAAITIFIMGFCVSLAAIFLGTILTNKLPHADSIIFTSTITIAIIISILTLK